MLAADICAIRVIRGGKFEPRIARMPRIQSARWSVLVMGDVSIQGENSHDMLNAPIVKLSHAELVASACNHNGIEALDRAPW